MTLHPFIVGALILLGLALCGVLLAFVLEPCEIEGEVPDAWNDMAL